MKLKDNTVQKIFFGFIASAFLISSLYIGFSGNGSDQQKIETKNPFAECAKNYSVSPGNLVLFYIGGEVKSQEFMRIVREVDELGSYFYYVEASDTNARKYFDECLSSVSFGWVPEVFCAGTGKRFDSSASLRNLHDFARECEAAFQPAPLLNSS